MEARYRSKAEAAEGRIDEDWGSLTWLASTALTGSDITVGRVIMKKGMSNPRHTHPNCTEVLYLLSGTLEHIIEGGGAVREPPVRQQAGDTLVVPAGVVHIAYSVGDDDADMIVAYPTGQRQFQVQE